jgi:hypothetical protein
MTAEFFRGQAVEPAVGNVDPGVDMKTPPKTQVDTMPAGKFFAYAAEILKLQPPHITDEPILAQMRRIGIERGKSFDIDKLDPATKTALETAPKDALALMAWKVASLARVVNGWSMNTDTMGVYGNYYLKRAIVTQLGLGANLPEDAIYPINLADDTGKPLDGANLCAARKASGAGCVMISSRKGCQVPKSGVTGERQSHPIRRFDKRRIGLTCRLQPRISRRSGGRGRLQFGGSYTKTPYDGIAMRGRQSRDVACHPEPQPLHLDRLALIDDIVINAGGTGLSEKRAQGRMPRRGRSESRRRARG